MLWEKLLYLNICACCHFRSLQCVKYPCGILLMWEVNTQWNTLFYLKCHQTHIIPTSHPPGTWDRVLQEAHHKLLRSLPKGVCGVLPCLQSPACNWKGSCPFHLRFFALCEKVEYAVVDTVCTVALSHSISLSYLRKGIKHCWYIYLFIYLFFLGFWKSLSVLPNTDKIGCF